MLNTIIEMDEKLLKIYKKGTYYNPAKSHYLSSDSDEEINVTCDRCQTNNLEICIGYKEHNLCMKCIDNIKDHITRRTTTSN